MKQVLFNKDFVTNIEQGENNFYCELVSFEESLIAIKEQWPDIWLLDIFAREKKQLTLCYSFFILDLKLQFSIELKLLYADTVPTLVGLWGSSYAFEQELNELYGIKFKKKYENIFFDMGSTVFPMRQDSTGVVQPKKVDLTEDLVPLVHSGLVSNQTSASIDWNSEKVKKGKLISGNYFVGLEKSARGMSYLDFMSMSENYFSTRGAWWSLSFCKLVEFENQLILPERGMALRMIEEELLRIVDHLRFLRNIYHELKARNHYLMTLTHIKTIQSLIVSFCGNANFQNMNKIGGVRKDIDQTWMSRAMDELENLLSELQKQFEKIEAVSNLDDTLSFSLLDKKDIFKNCLTGPIARACGVNLDLRKYNAYYFYSDIEFNIPVGANNSGYDLFCVRHAEILESLKIIIQVIDNLPTGFISMDSVGRLENLKLRESEFNEEEYQDNFERMMFLPTTKGTFFCEGSNGHLGLHLESKDSCIENLKYFSNDFNLKNTFSELMVGKKMSQVRLTWLLSGIDMQTVER